MMIDKSIEGRIKHISHNDLDGVGCTILSKSALGRTNVSAHNLNNNEIDDYIDAFLNGSIFYELMDEDGQDITHHDLPKHYDLILITDMSVNHSVAEKLNAIHDDPSMPDVLLLDHHKTALHLNDYPWAHVHVEIDGVKASGTSLLFSAIYPEGTLTKNGLNRKHFAETVRQYDTWDWFNLTDNKEAKQLNDYLFMMSAGDFEKHILNTLKKMDPDNPDYFGEKGRALLEQKEQDIQAYIKSKQKQLIIKDGVGHVFAESHTSELGNQLCLDNEEMDYVRIYDIGRLKVSFRAVKDDVDVSEIAKAMGGGGHAKAAGASLSQSIIDDIIG